MRKYDAVLEELDIKPTDHILEIGCGWGSFAVRAVSKYGCRWTGITISNQQLAMAKEQVRQHGLEDKIWLKLLDYRYCDMLKRVCNLGAKMFKRVNPVKTQQKK